MFRLLHLYLGEMSTMCLDIQVATRQPAYASGTAGGRGKSVSLEAVDDAGGGDVPKCLGGEVLKIGWSASHERSLLLLLCSRERPIAYFLLLHLITSGPLRKFIIICAPSCICFDIETYDDHTIVVHLLPQMPPPLHSPYNPYTSQSPTPPSTTKQLSALC